MGNLSDLSVIRNLLSSHGITVSKALGQNFLINPSVCPRMADASGCRGIGVLEIGPGVGVLTRELAAVAEKTVAVELDGRLLPVLSDTLKDCGNVKLIHGDIMKIDLQKLLSDEFEGMDVCVCANLPYYITSPVIMSLLESRLPFKSITVMVQREAAERLCAAAGTRESGAVTVAVHYYAEPKLLFHVSRSSFMPAPNVDSCVIQLKIREQPPFQLVNEKFFFSVVRAAFQQRRKTLANSVSAVLNMQKSELINALEKCGIPPASRAEQLSMLDFCNLSNMLFAAENGC